MTQILFHCLKARCIALRRKESQSIIRNTVLNIDYMSEEIDEKRKNHMLSIVVLHFIAYLSKTKG